jgi:hypothetical protein
MHNSNFFLFAAGLDPQGEAYKSNLIENGDFIIGIGNTSTIAKDFDFVLNTLSKAESPLKYTFFRGTKRQVCSELLTICLNMIIKIKFYTICSLSVKIPI